MSFIHANSNIIGNFIFWQHLFCIHKRESARLSYDYCKKTQFVSQYFRGVDKLKATKNLFKLTLPLIPVAKTVNQFS